MLKNIEILILGDMQIIEQRAKVYSPTSKLYKATGKPYYFLSNLLRIKPLST